MNHMSTTITKSLYTIKEESERDLDLDDIALDENANEKEAVEHTSLVKLEKEMATMRAISAIENGDPTVAVISFRTSSDEDRQLRVGNMLLCLAVFFAATSFIVIILYITIVSSK
jgi:hypothetical protein